MVSQDIVARVEKALEVIRPYLKNDGGDVSLVDISEDMVATVQLLGACDSCPYSAMTMRNGIEESIRRHVPEIQKVVAIDASAMS